MAIAAKLLNDQIKRVSRSNTLLDMLLEFERVLEKVGIYAYANWHKGEILDGPNLKEYYIVVSLLYKEKDMPDPNGAKRLMARDCLVKYRKNTLLTPVKVRSYDDITTEVTPTGQVKAKAKTKSETVWVVDIHMPRRYVDEFASNDDDANDNNDEHEGAEEKISADDRLYGEDDLDMDADQQMGIE